MGRSGVPATTTASKPPRVSHLITHLLLRKPCGRTLVGHQAIKTLMRWTAANERTVKNWLSEANGPSGEHLLEIIRNSDLAYECVLRLADRRLSLSNRKLEKLRGVLQNTMQLLSEMTRAQELPRSHQTTG
jgi:hypothetical protein